MTQVEKLVAGIVERSQARLEELDGLNEAQLEGAVRLEVFRVQGEIVKAATADAMAVVAEWYAARRA